MATIAWYSGAQPSFDGPLETTNSGSVGGSQEVVLIAGFIEGVQSGLVDFIFDWTPAPGTAPGELGGEYLTVDNTLRFAFPGFLGFDEKPSGTWNIRVSVDGVLSDGELVLTVSTDYGYYSSVSWGWNPTIPEITSPFWTRLKLAKQQPST